MPNAAVRANRTRVAFATLVGTTVEWYDFFIYANAVALVFAHQFFAPLGDTGAQLVAFASVGLSFLFRPLGAFLAGHYGDKLGRRKMLVITLLLMGGATTAIGLIPTYAAIGVAAPLLLLAMRILQGISAGGEWGGAVLMAVEHAGRERRGLAGAVPQLGVPLGMLLASGTMALMTGVIAPTEEAFNSWGWRVPFLLSFLLVFLGYWVRRSVDESPVFQEIAERKEQIHMPLVQLFKKYWYLVVLGALVFAGNNASGYMTTGGFITNYTTKSLGMNPTDVLLAVTAGSFFWFVFTLLSGFMADAIGRVRTYQIGFIILGISVFLVFPMISTKSLGMLYLALLLFSVGLGLTYGPQSALYSEMFPASVRFSGVSVSYAIGAIIGGAFSPMIAKAIFDATGSTVMISWYLLIFVVIALVAVSLIRDRKGIDLSISNEAEQAHGALVFHK
ncbi:MULTISPECIES: MFS transporter [Micrococcaceae]|uniref:MFS transporter n=1 Tax=Micrococcaceae TaxID=1268 RepID=UPI0008A2FF90|nr:MULTISPECIES: MFS transporter [Micrococcaceae]MCG7303776.1 MHS family MFS transporter [Pseudoglutamicibacter albus]OFT23257.1 MFS transporter [Arthrobacter sp. HMSC08H08]OFT43857.1 MFS transporter [Arthrobacter sp. HMSC06H05]